MAGESGGGGREKPSGKQTSNVAKGKKKRENKTESHFIFATPDNSLPC